MDSPTQDNTPKNPKTPSPLEEVFHPVFGRRNIRLYVKRDDLIDPEISGNKWRKLRLNLEEAKTGGHDTLLTFGGAHSNHLAATAAAALRFGFKSIGVVRGGDADPNNPTLKFAREQGMKLHFLGREMYRDKDSPEIMEMLRAAHPPFYPIPEGGANRLGVLGCGDIMEELGAGMDRIFVACGTATTLSGMALANENRSHLYGVSALKGGGFLLKNLEANLRDAYHDPETERYRKENVHFLLNHHFGGYAKTTDELIEFMRDFHRETGIQTDPVYTGKAAFAMVEMARRHKTTLPEKWALIHSGGMQGIPAMEAKLGYAIY